MYEERKIESIQILIFYTCVFYVLFGLSYFFGDYFSHTAVTSMRSPPNFSVMTFIFYLIIVSALLSDFIRNKYYSVVMLEIGAVYILISFLFGEPLKKAFRIFELLSVIGCFAVVVNNLIHIVRTRLRFSLISAALAIPLTMFASHIATKVAIANAVPHARSINYCLLQYRYGKPNRRFVKSAFELSINLFKADSSNRILLILKDRVLIWTYYAFSFEKIPNYNLKSYITPQELIECKKRSAQN